MITSERANHSRWCLQNPRRSEYVDKNNCSQMHTQSSISKRTLGIKKAWAAGKFDNVVHSSIGRKHTQETKEHLRQKALASPHRRLVRSIRDYVQKDGNIVKLDSAWEEALAKRLDDINVRWERPGPIKWTDSDGTIRNYFPDFYLTDYDLFLDPKNPQAFRVQQEKINCLAVQLKNLKILTSLEECKNYTPKLNQIKLQT